MRLPARVRVPYQSGKGNPQWRNHSTSAQDPLQAFADLLRGPSERDGFLAEVDQSVSHSSPPPKRKVPPKFRSPRRHPSAHPRNSRPPSPQRASAQRLDATEHKSDRPNPFLATLRAAGKPGKDRRSGTGSHLGTDASPYPLGATVHTEAKSSEQHLSGGTSQWKGDDWKDVWSVETLGAAEKPSTGESPRLHTPLPYTRRIEGLLHSANIPVLEDLVSPSDHRPIATLSHGLDRVLFNPGVYWLQDPRSKVFNFTPWLETIPNVQDFAFERLPGFIKSSRDEDLRSLAKREARTFGGSTSSLTGMLSHLYFLISGDRKLDTSVLSRHFRHEPRSFTFGQRMPASVLMNYKDGIYAVDSDSDKVGASEKNVLLWMGTLLEKFLTLSPEEFNTLMRTTPLAEEEEHDSRKEAYRYSKSSRFVLRSQLDCKDSRLPGTGIFDIKTRATLPVRLDLLNYEEYAGYCLRTAHGPLQSFEKEYYDLIRSAFLKYSFQARIGNMDGVFVAFHNTARIFGFQYISLEEMDERLFGGPGRGNPVFEKCMGLLEAVADEVIHTFPEQSLRCTFETHEGKDVMNVWIEPAEWPTSDTPIAQLDVSVGHFFGNTRVKGPRAIAMADAPWTLHWTICRSSLGEDEIRGRLAAAKERQFRAYNLPTGVDLDDMAQRWEQLDFSGKQSASSQDKVPFDPQYFRKAGRGVKELRALSRAELDESDRLALAEDGKQKVVWGEPEQMHACDPTDSESSASIDPVQTSAIAITADIDISSGNYPAYGPLQDGSASSGADSQQPPTLTPDAELPGDNAQNL